MPFSIEMFICLLNEEALIVTILTFLIIVTYFNIFFLNLNSFKDQFNVKLTKTTINSYSETTKDVPVN